MKGRVSTAFQVTFQFQVILRGRVEKQEGEEKQSDTVVERMQDKGWTSRVSVLLLTPMFF